MGGDGGRDHHNPQCGYLDHGGTMSILVVDGCAEPLSWKGSSRGSEHIRNAGWGEWGEQ